MGKINKAFVKKYGTLLLLAAGAGAIFSLPYIRETFYVPMQTAMGLTNAEMGMLTSWYAIVATFAYFIGGIIADKYPPRSLITFSFIATGLLGIWLSFFPGYLACRIIFALMGFTTVMTYWPSVVKAIRMLGTSEEQGRLFGLNEGLRGVLNALLVFIMAAVYAGYADNVEGAAQAIRVAAGADLIIGMLCWFVLDKGNTKDETEGLGAIALGMFRCLKIPRVWLLAGIVFTAYSVYGLMSYLNAYMVTFCDLSMVDSANLGGVRYLIQGVGGIVGGFLADKVHSRLKVISWSGALIALSYTLFLFMPANAVMLVPILINFLFSMMFVYVIRSLYFADIDEAGLPISIGGRVSGIVSTIGYLPDVFMVTMIGSWIDNSAGRAGYDMMFMYAIAMGIGCMILAVVLRRVIKKKPIVDIEHSTQQASETTQE